MSTGRRAIPEQSLGKGDPQPRVAAFTGSGVRLLCPSPAASEDRVLYKKLFCSRFSSKYYICVENPEHVIYLLMLRYRIVFVTRYVGSP